MARRGYPPEFRRRVVDLVEGGRKVAEVAATPGRAAGAADAVRVRRGITRCRYVTSQCEQQTNHQEHWKCLGHRRTRSRGSNSRNGLSRTSIEDIPPALPATGHVSRVERLRRHAWRRGGKCAERCENT